MIRGRVGQTRRSNPTRSHHLNNSLVERVGGICLERAAAVPPTVLSRLCYLCGNRSLSQVIARDDFGSPQKSTRRPVGTGNRRSCMETSCRGLPSPMLSTAAFVSVTRRLTSRNLISTQDVYRWPCNTHGGKSFRSISLTRFYV